MIKQVSMLFLALSVMLGAGTLKAQPKADKDKKSKMEKLNELRKKYFNEKLALSETEQKGFWPLYEEYKQKEKALRDSFRARYKPNDVVFMDDKQAEEFLNATIKLNEDQNNLFKEYIAKFKKVLTIKKVAMLPLVEREFKKEMLRRAKSHHGSGGHGPGHGGPDDE